MLVTLWLILYLKLVYYVSVTVYVSAEYIVTLFLPGIVTRYVQTVNMGDSCIYACSD